MSGSLPSVPRFLGKMLAAYVAWYVLYDLWLLPDGRLDAWVSHSVVEVAGGAFGAVGLEAVTAGRTIALPDTPGVKIVNGCNGLSPIGLFVGFVLAFPGRWRRRAWFVPLGAAMLYAANVGRIALLAGLQRVAPDAFAWIHGLGAPAVFYLVVFGLWVLWVRVGGGPADGPSEASPPSGPASAVATP